MLGFLKNMAKFAVILVITLYALIWVFSPYAAHYYISQYLAVHQLQLADESSIRYNPFLSKLTIHDVAISSVNADAINNSSTDDSIPEGSPQKVLELSALTLQVSAYRLLFEQIDITEFDIDGLYLLINKQVKDDSNLLTVAGISIPTSEKTTETEKTAASEKTAISSDNVLQLLMTNMTLRNSTIDVIETNQRHQLAVDKFTIDDVLASQKMQEFAFTLDADVEGAKVSISANASLENFLGTINLETEIEDIDINKFSHLATPNVTGLEGLVSYHAKHKINIVPGSINVDVVDLNVETKNLVAKKNDIHLSLAKYEFKSELFNIVVQSDAAPHISGESALILQGLNIHNESKDQVLVSMKEMNFDKVRLSTKEGHYEVAIDNVATLDTFFSDDTESLLPALSQFTALNINDIVLNNDSLAINAIELHGLKANAQIDENKLLKNLILSIAGLSTALNGKAEEQVAVDARAVEDTGVIEDVSANEIHAQEGESIPAAYEKVFKIKLNEFRIADSAEIYFLDSSVSPIYRRTIFLTEVSAGPFDNQQPNLNSVITIKGKSDQYDNFDIKIDAKPFLEVPVYDATTHIKEVQLTDLSGYIKQALGYEIDSGHLDLDMKVKLTGTKIDGKAEILLRGINLTSIDNPESGSLNEASSIPFNLALGMLKDSDGNVDLDLPLSGDTSSPSFGLSGFLALVVKRATIAGAKEYLTMTLIPYSGLVNIVMAADEYLLKIEINDLEYPATEVEVPEDQAEFLSDFAALLKEKPDFHVRLCGVASAADIEKESSDSIGSPEDIQKLISISVQRAINFKKYMVEEKEIKSSRLLLCKPKVDFSRDAKPHLRFEI